MSQQEQYTGEEAVEDVRTLVETIESTHPAPFVRAGGRFAFYESLQSRLNECAGEGCSERELRESLSALAARVQDGHTFVVSPMADGSIPVRLDFLDGGVRVTAVRGDVSDELVGARLLRVDDVEQETLVRRQASLRGSETPHGDTANLALSLRNWRSMGALLDRDDSPDRATFEFERPDGRVHRETVGPTDSDSDWRAPSSLDRPESGGWPTYRMLPGRNAAWLRVPSMTDYREQFEYRGEDIDERRRNHARQLYETANGESAPGDFAETLDGIPSAFEVFRDLATEMENAETETLVVDLRDNRGGSRVLADLLAYTLYGWEAVVTARSRPGAIRYSDQYVAERGTEPFERASEDRDWDLRTGEYSIETGSLTVENVQEALVERFPTFERLEAPEWPTAGRYTPPEVVAVSSATTFSAGLSLLSTLVRLGARTVGTPPVQAPTYFGDLLGFDLPNSEIRAMVATSRVETLPDGPDDVLEPDRQLTVEDWRSYDFDRDAAVRLALDEYC